MTQKNPLVNAKNTNPRNHRACGRWVTPCIASERDSKLKLFAVLVHVDARSNPAPSPGLQNLRTKTKGTAGLFIVADVHVVETNKQKGIHMVRPSVLLKDPLLCSLLTPTVHLYDRFIPTARKAGSRPSNTECIHPGFKHCKRHPWYSTSSDRHRIR